jgi:dTDP-4-dehydrorhamnose 3,5-epimerase
MELLKTQIEGLLILKPQIFIDARGLFFESYNEKTFESLGILDKFVQDNQSLSQKGVIRGLHYQKPPFAQAKLVRVIKGAALDVAVDIRKNSPTYGKYFSILLTGENNVQFYLPSGFAHGFASLEDDTIFAYKCSNFYNKESEESIIYNDPILNIDWQTNKPIVNDKDRKAQSFVDFVSPF